MVKDKAGEEVFETVERDLAKFDADFTQKESKMEAMLALHELMSLIEAGFGFPPKPEHQVYLGALWYILDGARRKRGPEHVIDADLMERKARNIAAFYVKKFDFTAPTPAIAAPREDDGE